MHPPEFSTTLTNDLRMSVEGMALEFQALSDLGDQLRQLLPDASRYFDGVSSSVVSMLTSNKLFGIFNSHANLNQRIEGMPFVPYSQNLVPVPENFKGNLAEYLSVVKKLDDLVYRQSLGLLIDYSNLLSRIISSRSYREHTVDHEAIKKKAESMTATINDGVNGFFKGDRQRARLRDVVRNPAQLIEVCEAMGQADPLNNRKDLESLNSKVILIATQLKLILKMLNKKEIEQLDDSLSMTIGNASFSIGKLVERCALFHYQKYVLLHTVDRIADQLDRDIK